MTDELDCLIEALREELIEFGEALALLEIQRDCVLRHSLNDLLANIHEVSRQTSRLLLAREKRDDCRTRLAQAFGKTSPLGIPQISRLAPADYQPLLQALAEDLEEVLRRFQKRVGENNRLIRRVLADAGAATDPSVQSLFERTGKLLAEHSHDS